MEEIFELNTAPTTAKEKEERKAFAKIITHIKTTRAAMKVSASILAMIAFVAIFMTVLTEARLGRNSYRSINRDAMENDEEFVGRQWKVWREGSRDAMDNEDDEFVGRPAHTRGNGRTYRSNGYTMNSRGYLANPSRSAQIKARNAGALTNSEARSMGLRNYRDEMDDDESVGRMPGFIGSTFRHSVNNQRPEVQRANRRGVLNGLKSTFQNPGDIPTNKISAAQKGLELGVKMRQNGFGSKGMGNWKRDEMDNDEESVGNSSHNYWMEKYFPEPESD